MCSLTDTDSTLCTQVAMGLPSFQCEMTKEGDKEEKGGQPPETLDDMFFLNVMELGVASLMPLSHACLISCLSATSVLPRATCFFLNAIQRACPPPSFPKFLSVLTLVSRPPVSHVSTPLYSLLHAVHRLLLSISLAPPPLSSLSILSLFSLFSLSLLSLFSLARASHELCLRALVIWRLCVGMLT